jgi:hypothetical protein
MKSKILFFIGIPILLFAILFNCAISFAKDQPAPEVYKDKNNFFVFIPPMGWVKDEVTTDTSSHVNFNSPDGMAGLGIIAQYDGSELNALFVDKKDYIKEFKRRFPRGKFSFAWDTLGERKVVKVTFEIPKAIKQEQYFFFDQGVRFDLVYGVSNAADYGKYEQAALDAFGTIQRQKMK